MNNQTLIYTIIPVVSTLIGNIKMTRIKFPLEEKQFGLQKSWEKVEQKKQIYCKVLKIDGELIIAGLDGPYPSFDVNLYEKNKTCFITLTGRIPPLMVNAR